MADFQNFIQKRIRFSGRGRIFCIRGDRKRKWGPGTVFIVFIVFIDLRRLIFLV